MNGRDERKEPERVPSYQAPPDTPWYHFLHGNVPNHQIDFIYRPEVPQGRLTRQHFSHLARLMSYIEPERRDMPAFAIGNLSRDDTQHEPGHGAVAILFAMRIRGATDHAGRPDPPFSHAIAAADRELDKDVLFAASLALYEHIRREPAGQGFYPQYVHSATASSPDLAAMLDAHVAAFDDLPRPGASMLALRWTGGRAAQSRRVVIVRPDDCPFEQIARCAAQIAAVLYRSDIRWTSITSGREPEIPNGVSIRFVAERDGCHIAPDALILPMDHIPAGDDELAFHLFGATPVHPDAAPQMAAAPPECAIASDATEACEEDVGRPERGNPPVPERSPPPSIAPAPPRSMIAGSMPAEAAPAPARPLRWVRVGLALACLLSMAVGAYEVILSLKSPGDLPALVSPPRDLHANPVAAGPPPSAVSPPVKGPDPSEPHAALAEKATTPAHRTPSPTQPPGPRGAPGKPSRAAAAGSGQPAPSSRGPEAPPFRTLDNEPVD